MKSASDILKTAGASIKKTIWVLGLHAFSLILLLVLCDIIIGGFVFYNYVFLAERESPQITGTILKFDYKTYQDVMSQLQARNQESMVPPIQEPVNITVQAQATPENTSYFLSNLSFSKAASFLAQLFK